MNCGFWSAYVNSNTARLTTTPKRIIPETLTNTAVFVVVFIVFSYSHPICWNSSRHYSSRQSSNRISFHEGFLTVFFSDLPGSELEASVSTVGFCSCSASCMELEDCVRRRRIRRFSNSAGDNLYGIVFSEYFKVATFLPWMIGSSPGLGSPVIAVPAD
jgi:hypothetical protein